MDRLRTAFGRQPRRAPAIRLRLLAGVLAGMIGVAACVPGDDWLSPYGGQSPTPPPPAAPATTVPAAPTATTAASPTATAMPVMPTTAPAARPVVPVSADEVVRGDPSRPWVSLVFNAGAGYQPSIATLDALKASGVRTTFFLMGWFAEKEPDVVRRINADGHEIASHGYRVPDLTTVSDAAVIADLEQANSALMAVTGKDTRPLWSPSAGARDARVRRLAASIGYRPFYWTVDGDDWRIDSTVERVEQRVLGGAVNGAIIVLHIDSARSADTIAAGIPRMVSGLRARGFRLVTVTELVTGQLIDP